jgi:hypothetical protein
MKELGLFLEFHLSPLCEGEITWEASSRCARYVLIDSGAVIAPALMPTARG